MKKDNQTLEVLEPEVEEIPLEEVINKSLVKHNVTDAVIASLKEKYGSLSLKDIEDKESYIEIKEARREVRKVGILVEKLCKKGREDAVSIQRKWLAKEKEVLAKVSEVEEPLNSEIKRFEDEVERKELLEIKKREEIYINRQSILLKYGAQYNNGSFELKHISYEIELIKQADDEQWNDTILPKYRKIYEEVEAARVEEENKRKSEMELQKKQREELEAQQAAFKLQQEEFAKQQKELQLKKDEHERQQRLDQERKDAVERQKKQTIINDRENQLRGLGMAYNHIYNNYSFEDIVIDVSGNETDEQWNALIEKIIPEIKVKKDEEEKRKFALQEKLKKEAIAQALEDEKIKKQQEQARKDEELAQSNDKTKWVSFINEIKMIPISEMKSPLYKRKLQSAKEKIEEILSL